MMAKTVTLSNDYKLIIPKEICIATGLKAGTTFEVMLKNNKIALLPINPVKELKGIFIGIDTNVIRENNKNEDAKVIR
ncbi:MAG: AbrB/MazE/SpoVT family DNA-binding domain-containing protein [Spirochaetes bacterium]|nr:AbrB/MazE/SpoVT family DNA-binding domain-containing protein [Spirochaetota bacterium]